MCTKVLSLKAITTAVLMAILLLSAATGISPKLQARSLFGIPFAHTVADHLPRPAQRRKGLAVRRATPGHPPGMAHSGRCLCRRAPPWRVRRCGVVEHPLGKRQSGVVDKKRGGV